MSILLLRQALFKIPYKDLCWSPLWPSLCLHVFFLNILLLFFKFIFSSGWACSMQDLSSLTMLELMPPALKMGNPHPWTPREAPAWIFLMFYFVSGHSWLTMLSCFQHVSILPQTPLPSWLPHNTEQSSLCYTAGLCCLSILNIAMGACVSQSPWPALSPTSHPPTCNH